MRRWEEGADLKRTQQSMCCPARQLRPPVRDYCQKRIENKKMVPCEATETPARISPSVKSNSEFWLKLVEVVKIAQNY